MRAQSQLFTMRILWGALLVSQGIYLGLVVGHVFPPAEAPPEPIMLTALAAVSMMTGAASLFVPRILYRSALASPAFVHGTSGADGTLVAALRVAMAPFIIGCALAESIATEGLVLSVLGFPLLSVAPFFGAGCLLMLAQFPTEGRFRGPMEEVLASRRG